MEVKFPKLCISGNQYILSCGGLTLAGHKVVFSLLLNRIGGKSRIEKFVACEDNLIDQQLHAWAKHAQLGEE